MVDYKERHRCQRAQVRKVVEERQKERKPSFLEKLKNKLKNLFKTYEWIDEVSTKTEEDEGTKLEQEVALSGFCNCDWCKEYRRKHKK